MRLPRIHALTVASALVAAAATPAYATNSVSPGLPGSPHADVRLIGGIDQPGAGPAIATGLAFRLAEGWHAYWRTPGDAGIPPHFDWAGSQNVADVTVDWPAPQRLDVAGFESAVYTGQFILPLTVRRQDASAPARLAVSLDYALCGAICVPAHADLSLAMPAGPEAAALDAPALAMARASVPGTLEAAGFEVRRIAQAGQTPRTLTVSLASPGMLFRHPDLFVEGADGGLAAAPVVVLGDGGHTATLTARLPDSFGDHPRLTLVDNDRSATIPFAAASPVSTTAARSLPAILLIALAGGLILNLMPCVLPVLAIKLSGVLRHAGQRRREIRVGFTLTAAGILASVLVLATVPIGLKLAGATVGWGVQFQQPWFLAGLAVMTTLFAASLFDWLPIGLPAVAGRLGGSGGSHHAEAFLAGVASTLLATPCSAPFVGTAVGFALARGPVEIVAVFACLGVGMALPFLLIAAVPGLVAWLPRPGAWMLHLRRGFGILLLATAGWLVSVLTGVAGLKVAVNLSLLLVCLLLLWGWQPWWTAIRATRGLATLGLAILGIGEAAFAHPYPLAAAATEDWAVYDPAAVDRAVAAGRTVLVDVTARWCLTCKINDLSTLDRDDVRRRLTTAGIVRLRADWSHPDPEIAAFLQRFGRFGIPFDIVYGPGHPSGEPLPELLTPALLLAALDRAEGPHGPAAATP